MVIRFDHPEHSWQTGPLPRFFNLDLARAFNSMAERLKRLLHSKEHLLPDVSPELRSPITRLKVQLEFLEDADARESLGSDLAEMEAMVTTLLESARLWMRRRSALKLS